MNWFVYCNQIKLEKRHGKYILAYIPPNWFAFPEYFIIDIAPDVYATQKWECHYYRSFVSLYDFISILHFKPFRMLS